MNHRLIIFLHLILILSILSGCDSEGELPNEPVINNITFESNLKNLVIQFTDGDGNYGLGQGDTLPPYQPFEDEAETIENPFHYNYWMNVYVKRDGGFVLLETPSTFDFRVPVLTPQGQNKQLRVTINNDLELELEALAQSQAIDLSFGDTIKFAVTLVDQDLNISNVAETGEIILNN